MASAPPSSPRDPRAADRSVRKNDKGGVFVSDAEIETAVRWISKGKDTVTFRDLRERLLPFYPDMPVAELKFLMGEAKEISIDELKTLLKDNTIQNFDPVSEAFDAFDITGTGVADVGFMSAVFHQLGFERLGEEDLAVILKTADVDRDGEISLDDFRSMLARANKQAQAKRPAISRGSDDDELRPTGSISSSSTHGEP